MIPSLSAKGQVPARKARKSEAAAELKTVATTIALKCIDCRRCRQNCAFLSNAGKPVDIAQAVLFEEDVYPYNCSLCGLCSEVCPENLPLKDMFLLLRRKLVSEGAVDFAPYRRLLSHERIGRSRAFVSYALPDGCDTVFFPGCNLPGSRPEQTHWLFLQLQKHFNCLGIVLDCCLKPSHDLGRQEWFRNNFFTIVQRLLDNGISRVLTGCPSCHWIFREYGGPLQVTSAYEVLADDVKESDSSASVYRLHDACTARYEDGMQQAVRKLAIAKGLELQETKHSGNGAICCGQGGGVFCVAPELADGWTQTKEKESAEVPVLTYCGGCHEFLRRRLQTTHILDVLHNPQRALAGEQSITSGPRAYFSRLRFKRRIVNDMLDTGAATRAPKYRSVSKIVPPATFFLTAVYAVIKMFAG